MSVDASDLERYLALLTTADAAIDVASAAALRRTQEALASYAASIAHRVSGQMAETIHGIGPFAGGGMLESQISSAASYTLAELDKGGDHDWASRTLVDQAARLDALADETGRIVATAIGGGP